MNARSPAETGYTCTFRGSILVDIAARNDAPPTCPLYRRAHLKEWVAPTRKTVPFLRNRTMQRCGAELVADAYQVVRGPYGAMATDVRSGQ